MIVMKTKPSRQKKPAQIAKEPIAKPRERKSVTSSTGLRCRRSYRTKASRKTAAPTSAPTTGALPQPKFGASIRAHTSRVIPEIDSSTPRRSKDGRSEPNDSGTRARQPTIATIEIGTLIQNTDDHAKCSTR